MLDSSLTNILLAGIEWLMAVNCLSNGVFIGFASITDVVTWMFVDNAILPLVDNYNYVSTNSSSLHEELSHCSLLNYTGGIIDLFEQQLNLVVSWLPFDSTNVFTRNLMQKSVSIQFADIPLNNIPQAGVGLFQYYNPTTDIYPFFKATKYLCVCFLLFF